MLARWLKPQAYYQSLDRVNYQRLWDEGYRLILADLDNTLISDRAHEVTPYATAQIQRMRKQGFVVAVLSNGISSRVSNIAESLDVDFVAPAKKPSRRAVWVLSKRSGIPLEQTILIGDQLFTDVLCGRRAKVYTILVDPLMPRERWYIRVKRKFESMFKSILSITQTH